MLPTDHEIKQTVLRAVDMPDCPVKRQHATARRIMLENEIRAYIAETIAHYEQPIKSEY